MLRVALTGGIGTGKSVVRAVFAELGMPVVDADALVHEALDTEAVAAGIRQRFGGGVFGADGRVDRRRLGAVVFDDEAARRDLEALLHPIVYLAIDAWMREQAAHGATVAAAEIPLLYETGREGAFDRVVVVACDPATQVARVVERSGITADEARRRVAAQQPIAAKVERADTVVWTDGTLEESRARARTAGASILRDSVRY